MIFSTSLPRFKAFLADFSGKSSDWACSLLFITSFLLPTCRRSVAAAARIHPPRNPRTWLAAPLARRLDGTGCSSRCCSEPALACCPRPRRPPAHSRHRLHHAWSAGPTHAEHLLVPQYPETPQQVRSPPEEVPPPLGTLLCLRSAADPQRPAYSLLAPVLYQAALCHLRRQAVHAGRPGRAFDRLPSAGCAHAGGRRRRHRLRVQAGASGLHAGTGSG